MSGEPGTASQRGRKSPSAFRTISEVADELHIPQHVLRFWETKFPQLKPLKRGGGRRYYRPEDVELLRRISDLLYIQGYTIKGVQRLLRDGVAEAEEEAGAEPAAEAASGAEAPRPQLPLPGMPGGRAEGLRQRPAKPVVRVRAERAGPGVPGTGAHETGAHGAGSHAAGASGADPHLADPHLVGAHLTGAHLTGGHDPGAEAGGVAAARAARLDAALREVLAELRAIRSLLG